MAVVAITFQYLKGAIQSAYTPPSSARARSAFNTSKVRFRVVLVLLFFLFEVTFNTSKVRFRASARATTLGTTTFFQYLKGAIQSTIDSRTPSCSGVFQYLKGAIQSPYLICEKSARNATDSRLKTRVERGFVVTLR